MATQATRSYSAPNAAHRSTNSISSTGSGKSSRSNRSGVESAVTRVSLSELLKTLTRDPRLLIAIRQLLESLTHWSNDTVTEDQVSDVYVRLGNDFNLAVAAFTSCNIDMNDLMSVPQDLRMILEACLAEEPSPATLEQYLPQVRQIITNLLQGLRVKQSQYRRLTDRRSSRKEDPTRESEDLKSLRRGSGSGGGASREDRRSTTPEVPSDRERSSQVPRRNDSLLPSSVPQTIGDSPSDSPPRIRVEGDVSPQSTPPSRPGSSSLQTMGSSDSVSSVTTSTTVGEDLRRGKSLPFSRTPSEARSTPTPPPLPAIPLPVTPPAVSPTFVPPSVKRYSLTDMGVAPPPPTVLIQSSSDANLSRISEGDTEGGDDSRLSQEALLDPSQAPEVASSLRALKKSDTLERRASKRFSTYNFQKMTGSRVGTGGGPGHARIAGSGSLSPGDLAKIAEVDEVSPTRTVTRVTSRGKSVGKRDKGPPPVELGTPPMPPIPTIDSSQPRDPPQGIDGLPSTGVQPGVPTVFPPSPTILAFLQVGREVKKVPLEGNTSLRALRILFMDKFAYNPGQDNFPAIYIKDPLSGVQYELEDVDEIKDNCLLSLNIEPLDQIKQHIDLQMSTLSREIKDLRQSMNSSHRVSVHQIAQPVTLQSPVSPPARPTDKQFRDAARRLSRMQSDDHDTMRPMAPIQPQLTGMVDSRLVSDLRTQFDEVQNLRRDLGVMRQLYSQFMSQTKESLGGLRTQAQGLRQAANSKVGGGRAFIDSGKPRLDSRTQDVLTKVEEFQDAIENLKDDVVKRHTSPRRHVLKNLKGDMDAISAELESLQEHIRNVKPMWKKTWEEELQNIVEEQQFLLHQEELLEDLVQDLKATAEVHSHLDKIIAMRGETPGPSSLRGRSFKPIPPEEGQEGGLDKVMLQIRGSAVDTERRLKAIQMNQKQREKEKAGKSDEFEAELAGFVKGNKLKMTGGAEEVERVRQKKSEATIKSMFSGEPL